MRKTVVLIECERCHREEKVEVDTKQESRKVAFQIGDASPTVLYQDLCTPCYGTILNCLQMMQPTDKKSPIRVKKRGKKEAEANGASHPAPPAAPVHIQHPGPVRAPRG